MQYEKTSVNKVFEYIYSLNLSTYFETIIRPATKFEDAGLFVERKILNIDLTRGFVNSRWFPLDQALVVDGSFGSKCHFEVAVRAEMVIDKDQQPETRSVLFILVGKNHIFF